MKLLSLALLGAVLVVSMAAGPSPSQVRDAVMRAQEINTLKREVDHMFARSDVSGPQTPTCTHMLKNSHGKRRVQSDQTASNTANDLLLTARLLRNEGFTQEELQTPEVTSEVSKRLECPTTVVRADCDFNSPYRTPDGSCNNRNNPMWGMAGVEQRRSIPPAYADANSGPRASSAAGNNVNLPNPRRVSNRLHGGPPPPLSQDLTLHTFQMGQFLDHDVILTPLADASQCCAGSTSEECFPLIVTPGDNQFPNNYCMDVARSAAFSDSCQLGVRQQGNALTSYVDASNVYGSSQSEQNDVRQPGTGFLKMADGDRLPNNPDSSHCELNSPGQSCSLAGDVRVDTVPSLASYHTLFVREHNRIAAALSAGISDPETLFQETRRLVIAEMQHIVYDGYLAAFLRPEAMTEYGLASGGYQYQNDVDATITNGFGIAYRFGHTWIPRDMSIFGQNLRPVLRRNTEETYNDPDLTYQNNGIDGLAFWLSGDNSPETDRQVERAARNLLFLDDQGDSLDLAALNIHRGRDHGVPSYYSYRQWCGLSDADSFTTGAGGLVHHDQATVDLLNDVYDDTRDIDLFTGVTTETPLAGGAVGPTLECILGRQFQALKQGDRFWYEGRDAGFTADQQAEIRKTSIARVLCDNMNFRDIHQDAFRSDSGLVRCNTIEGMDLSKFGATATTTTTTTTTTRRPPRNGGGRGGGGQRGGPRGLEEMMRQLLEDLEDA